LDVYGSIEKMSEIGVGGGNQNYAQAHPAFMGTTRKGDGSEIKRQRVV
jgi:hypothetical protein